jgi:hypothetical protein
VVCKFFLVYWISFIQGCCATSRCSQLKKKHHSSVARHWQNRVLQWPLPNECGLNCSVPDGKFGCCRSVFSFYGKPNNKTSNECGKFANPNIFGCRWYSVICDQPRRKWNRKLLCNRKILNPDSNLFYTLIYFSLKWSRVGSVSNALIFLVRSQVGWSHLATYTTLPAMCSFL